MIQTTAQRPIAPYLIAYDIAHPRRLRRVARLLEKHAIRCQKSVFVFHGTSQRLASVLDQVAALIEPALDLVQAWKLAPRETVDGWKQGHAAVLLPDAVVIHGNQVHSITES